VRQFHRSQRKGGGRSCQGGGQAWGCTPRFRGGSAAPPLDRAAGHSPGGRLASRERRIAGRNPIEPVLLTACQSVIQWPEAWNERSMMRRPAVRTDTIIDHSADQWRLSPQGWEYPRRPYGWGGPGRLCRRYRGRTRQQNKPTRRPVLAAEAAALSLGPSCRARAQNEPNRTQRSCGSGAMSAQ
jgi:hypothetical protein